MGRSMRRLSSSAVLLSLCAAEPSSQSLFKFNRFSDAVRTRSLYHHHWRNIGRDSGLLVPAPSDPVLMRSPCYPPGNPAAAWRKLSFDAIDSESPDKFAVTPVCRYRHFEVAIAAEESAWVGPVGVTGQEVSFQLGQWASSQFSFMYPNIKLKASGLGRQPSKAGLTCWPLR